MKLLLAEDDFDFSDALSHYLAARGWEVLCCADGMEALALGRKQSFDAILLDLSLPGLDGLEVLQRLRSDNSTTPILVITARGQVTDKVLGLETGADDYLPKPFDLSELDARLRALTRRFGREGQLRCGLLRYDTASETCYCSEQPLDLSPRESVLLRVLMARVDRVVPRDELLSRVFGTQEPVKPDALDVLVHRLRKKLAGACAEVVNLRGVGFQLRDETAAARPPG
ncbi:MAG: response regulator transcription factor [Burkholderiales bacterium]|nr:response regulator transcription factor [Burkholderiales bacterium]